MIITLDELNTEQVTYLQNKLATEVKELNDNIATAKSRLASRIERSNSNEGELVKLEATLAATKSNLDYLVANNAPANLQTSQQETVAAHERAIIDFSRRAGLLSDENAVLEQFEIERLELELHYLQGKLNELEVLPLAS